MADLGAVAAEKSSARVSTDRAIDLVHLARMTFGDRSLEREVLALFDRQASMLIERMKRVGAAAVPSLAHTLKGSARGIGAQRVARAAEKVERAAVAGEDEVKAALVELEEATTEARATIADLLRAL